jgi:hypothetical protein
MHYLISNQDSGYIQSSPLDLSGKQNFRRRLTFFSNINNWQLGLYK